MIKTIKKVYKNKKEIEDPQLKFNLKLSNSIKYHYVSQRYKSISNLTHHKVHIVAVNSFNIT
jgi:hypothetical protein